MSDLPLFPTPPAPEGNGPNPDPAAGVGGDVDQAAGGPDQGPAAATLPPTSDSPKERGELAEGRPEKRSQPATVSLDDLGLTKSQSSRYQAEAAIPAKQTHNSDPDTIPAAKPILVTRPEIRALLERGETEIRRRIRPCPVALQRTWRVGDTLWGRESISTRLDGQRVKVRYPADGPAGQPRYVPIDVAGKRFATEGYRTWASKHCPRWAARLLLEVVGVRTEHHDDREAVVLMVRRTTEGRPDA